MYFLAPLIAPLIGGVFGGWLYYFISGYHIPEEEKLIKNGKHEEMVPLTKIN